MPNLILEKKWTRWYPKKIFFKNKKNNKKFLYSSDQYTQDDFYLDVHNKKQCHQDEKNNISTIDITTTKEYTIGFEKGLSEGVQENILLKNQLNNLLLDYEKSFSELEKILYSRVLKTVLIVSSYVIGHKTNIDELILLKSIKKTINKDGMFLKKPHLIIHSNNRLLIEKTFKNFLHTYKWKLVCDDNIDINSFKITSESSDIDVTVDARWQELCRLLYSEEY
ncbi:flagellar assembly protein FliH [Buchnera aphidicola (Brachycaudus cardui)]|uniref:Flagellar assembly protein FliH n=1 Tax=Buchnera aphidicola (Brachycaudus cardui) TaxID=557993 RepID=A0A4D6XRS3_9GAMM|nr:FliH/SctL family protein [Buchnera aphidicola]QCI20232.1 flagellar assembly protein FliH [Buchnera aphidicola (Brachycaudus cardui)]